MHKKRAFTLIELLVVIAIIALLMSILMPALAKVRKQAMSVVCRSRMKQWGVVLSMYTNENDGFFLTRAVGTNYYNLWPYVYKTSYKDKMMRFCPTAENPKRYTGTYGTWNYGAGGSYFPLPTYPMSEEWKKGCGESEYQPFAGRPQVDTYANGYFTGSFGVNRYSENPTTGTAGTSPDYWRRADIRGGDKAPVLMDCQYVYFWATTSDLDPPEHDGDFSNEMQFLCINRHMGYVNGVFLDFSARKVGLKELWTLKHSRRFNTCGIWTKCGGVTPDDWPDWMKGLKDY